MMSLETIRQMADEAAKRAAEREDRPYVLFNAEEVDRLPGGKTWDKRKPYPFPNLGSYDPPGWKMVDDWLVDATGMGADDEPALTMRQLNARLKTVQAEHPEYGYGIVEVGQFQIVLGVFAPEEG